ncbi:MAG: histidine kinase [Bacteroidota bacterium]
MECTFRQPGMLMVPDHGALIIQQEKHDGRNELWATNLSGKWRMKIGAAVMGPRRIGQTRMGLAVLNGISPGINLITEPDGVTLLNAPIRIPFPNLDDGGAKSRYINFRVANGKNWLMTYDGAILYEVENGKMVVQRKILEGYAVSDIVADVEGNYWISTLKGGIFMVPSMELNLLSTAESPLGSRSVSCISNGLKGEMIAGGASGIVARISEKNGAMNAAYPVGEGGLVQSVGVLPQHEIMLAGVFYLNACHREQENFITQAIVGSPKQILVLEDGSLLTGGAAGFGILPSMEGLNTFGVPEGGIRERRNMHGLALEALGAEFWMLDSIRVRALVEDGAQHFWVARADGLFRYDRATLTATEVRMDGAPVHAQRLARTADGTIWVALMGGGLHRINLQNGAPTLATEATVPEIRANCLKAEGNRLFLGSSRGLHVYDSAGRLQTAVDRLDGLPSNEVNDLAFTESALWLATSDGIAVLPKSFSGRNTAPPPIQLRGLSVNQRDTSLTASMRLSHDQNNLRFDLGTISYRSRGRFLFRYRLRGLDTAWVALPRGSHEVRFPSLPPGAYMFEASAENEDGVRSAMPATFEFEILPALWQRWWFWPGMAALTVLLASLLIYARFRGLQVRERLKTEKAEAELAKAAADRARRQSQLASLRSQMNPHFMYNMLNTLQSFILTDDKREANRYLGYFSDLMRKSLAFSRKDLILLSEEIALLEIYLKLEALRFGETFNWSLIVGDGVEPTSTELPPLLIQPFVENAIKHGLLHKEGERRLSINFQLDEAAQRVTCSVMDNGVGRKRSGEIQRNDPARRGHDPFAMSASRDRLRLLNEMGQGPVDLEVKDVKDANGQAAGTHILLSFPFSFPDLS